MLTDGGDLGIEGILLSRAEHRQFTGRLTIPVAAHANRGDLGTGLPVALATSTSRAAM